MFSCQFCEIFKNIFFYLRTPSGRLLLNRYKTDYKSKRKEQWIENFLTKSHRKHLRWRIFLGKLRTPFYVFSYEFCKIVTRLFLSLHKKWSFPLRISSVTAELVTFTEEILNGKLHFLCSVSSEYSPEVHSESSQMFKRKSFVEIINRWKPLNIFTKRFRCLTGFWIFPWWLF